MAEPELKKETQGEKATSSDDSGELQDGSEDKGENVGMLVLAGEITHYVPEGNTSRQFDVVAVHGLYGHREQTWTDEGTEANWLKDQIYEHFPESRILTWGYDSSDDIRGGITTILGIRQKALQLLEALVEHRKTADPDIFRPIVFVAHDIGAIIVKEATWIAAMECRRYKDIAAASRLTIYFGCPHRCASIDEMEDNIARLFFAKENPWPSGATRKIKELSRSILDVNGRFTSTEFFSARSIISVYSTENDAAQQVFDKYTSTFGSAFEEGIACANSHQDICKISAYEGLYEKIHLALTRDSSPLRPGSKSVDFIENFRILSSPIRPFNSLCGNAHLLDWISQDKTYKEWFDSSEVSILNVHGSSGTSSAAEYIFQRFEERRAAKPAKFTIAYFTFHQHDNRRNSVLHMLNTLLSQIFNHKHDFADLMDPWSDEMRIHRSWTQGDLFLMFCQLLSRWDHNVLCVINGLDKCDNSRSAFVKDLCTFASISEHHFKIAITSNSNSDLQATLTNWPTINLDNQPAGLGSMKTRLATDISHEVQDVVLHRPELGSFDNIITERLSLCGKDKRWRRILQNQLKLGKSSTSRLATRQQLENLPSTLHGIFANILASVPADRRTWARKAISWISNAILPLKIWELTFALAFDVDNPPEEISDIDELLYQGTASDLEDYFGGMFVVENNEVYIGHPDVKEFFLAANGEEENVWYDVKETAHQDITDVCHAYLSSQEVKDLITSIFLNPNYDLQDNSTNSTPRMLFSSYAVEFWPTHYSLIPETRRPTKRALEFVQNKKTLRCWAELYWVKSNTVTRTNRSFLSLLPLFAGLGLQDLVNQWLELETEGPEASKDHALALTEAARNGHAEVVVKLLELGGYNKDNLQDTLITSVGLCNEVVLSKLIDYVVGNLENFDWPPAVLCRAAQYGLEDVVRKLLQGGASLENATTVQNMTPLHLASRGGHEGVVKVLMEYKANITAVCLRGRTPLLSASVCGHSAIVTLLLDAGADVNFRDTEDNDALLLTCIKGYHKTVEILSNAGCNVGYKKTGWSPLVIVCDQGFFKCAQLLLKNKLDLEIEGFSDWTPLRYAAVEGHRRLCELLLKNGANVDSSRGGAPIIKECATLGAFELVKLLVEHGATIDAVDTDGFTALTTAAIRGDTRIVTFLLDHGANINHEIGSGHTALLLAAQEGFAELVQILIDRGADMERKSTKEWGALHLSYDHAESARVLLENKADVNKLVGYYSTLHLSTEYNYVEAVKVLLSFNPDLEITFDEEGANKGFTALLYGTAGGNCEIVRLLLEAGANVNHQTENNNFALQYALKDSNEAMVRALMEYNPDLNLVDNDGDTALNCLNSSTSVAVVKLLVNGGLDIDIANKEGSTPLSKAVATQNVEVIKYLIAKKAKVNIMGGPSGGPLHNACALANLELVKILVAAGADVNLVVPSGLGTPLQSACVCNDPADTDSQETVVRYLINEAKADVTTVGGKFGCAINTACGWSTSDMVKLMLEKGAKVDVADSLGRMAVHYAAKEGLEYFQPVLDAGADVEVKDKMGRTLLHWAVAGGLVDVVERVLSLSRRLLDQPDVDGWTPLLWAVKKQCDRRVPAPSNSQEEIVKLLLDRGADPCVVGKGIDREWSAVKIARYQGADDSIVQLLIAKAQEKIATLGEGKTWDEEFNESKRAQEQSHFCDSCFATVYGICYKCATCSDFDLCFKCYNSRNLTHPGHSFTEVGVEYEVVETDPPQEGADEEDDTDDDDTDDEDTEDEAENERTETKVKTKVETEVPEGNKKDSTDEDDSSDDDDDNDE